MKAKMGLVVGAAMACAAITGCKAAKPLVRAEEPRQQRAVATVPVAQTQPKAVVTVAPKPTPAPMPPKCKCAPGTVHDKPCACGGAGCACKVKAPEPEYTLYRVKSGDVLSGICNRYKVKQSAVLKLNPGMNPNKIFVGLKIKLPGKVELRSDDAANLAKKPAAAKRVGKKSAKKPVTATSVKAEGKKPAEKPVAAQNVAKPEKKPVEAKPVEKPAEKPAEVKAEEKPAAPATAVEPKEEPASAPVVEEAAKPAPATHTVKDGEDTVSIAIDYGISPSALMDINNLKNGDVVTPGQVLKLPENAKKQ